MVAAPRIAIPARAILRIGRESSTMARSAGSVSSSVRRRARPNGTMVAPSRNAIRHPQASNKGGGRVEERVKPTEAATRPPRSAVAMWRETNSPRRPDGAASSSHAVFGPTSPPSAKPWTRRNSTARRGAAMPMTE
jgi:hypothetical protein